MSKNNMQNSPNTTPTQKTNGVNLPPVKQDVVFRPRIDIVASSASNDDIYDTQRDYQPKRLTRKSRRVLRGKNIFVGLLAFVFSAIVLIPYILGVFDVQIDLPVQLVPHASYNAIGNFVYAIKYTIAGAEAEELKAVWLGTVPSLVLILGLLSIVGNLFKGLFSALFRVKPSRYASGALFYLVCVLANLVIALIGAPSVGIEKIDFMQDFIYGYATSELFMITMIALGNFIICAVLSIINRDRRGYLA